MKKAGRQSHFSKSTALKHDTSVADIEGKPLQQHVLVNYQNHCLPLQVKEAV